MSDFLDISVFDETERLIVVAAHPDDLECLCGGTTWMLAQRGVQIASVNCTMGDIGAQNTETPRPALAALRLAESADAAEMLGIAQTYNLSHPDGELVATLQLRAQLARLYRITRADTLITFDPHWRGQMHPDHRAAGQAALDAFMPSKMPLYHPEQLDAPDAQLGQIKRILLFSPEEADVFVDVTDVYAHKLAACMTHRSQFPEGEKSLDWLKELDRRSGKQIGVEYAEAFKEVAVW